MGPTISYATERGAYTLSDRGTYYALAFDDPPRTDLQILCEGDPRLANPYSVIAVDPARFPHVQAQAAQAYVQWLTSTATQERIDAFQVGGRQLFHAGEAPPVVGSTGSPEGPTGS